MGTSLNTSISMRKGTIKQCYPTVIYSTRSFFLLRGLKTWVEESLMGQRYNEWSTSVLQPWLQWSLSTAGWLAKLYSMSSSLYSSALLIKASAFASSPATTPYQQVFVSSDRTMNPRAPESKQPLQSDNRWLSELRLDALQWLFLQRLAALKRLKCHLTRWAGKIREVPSPVHASFEGTRNAAQAAGLLPCPRKPEDCWTSLSLTNDRRAGNASTNTIALCFQKLLLNRMCEFFFCFTRLELQFI